MDKGEIMNTVKETTLHPDGNDGVDLYPKTNINQVEGLKEKIEIYDNYQERIINLETGKLNKPAIPSVDSVVTMLANGTVGTKPLSEIGGGGSEKWYRHDVEITNIKENSNDIFQMSFLSRSGNKTTDINQIVTYDGFTQIVSLIGDIKINIIDGSPISFPLTSAYGYLEGVIYNNNLASHYKIYYQEISVNNAGQDGVPANITHVDTVTEL